MKSISTLSFIAAGLVIFSSCKREDSANIDQQRIYANYEYIFDADSYQSIAEVTFRMDNNSGTKIELTSPSSVRFNGETLSWRNSSGSYRISNSSNVIGGVFTYSDLGKQTYDNPTATLTYIELPNGLNGMSRNSSFFLPWIGSPLQNGETITVTIGGGQQTTTRSWTINTLGATYILLDQYKLNDLIAGTAQIQIERQVVTGLHQSTLAGGKISSTYKSQKFQIVLTD